MLATANYNDGPPGGGLFHNHTPIKPCSGAFFEKEPKSPPPHDTHTPTHGNFVGGVHKPTKRWVRVAKRPKEDFGAQLWSARGKVYVVFVSEYPISNALGAGKPVPLKSAAYRIGLRFGDEIVSVNEIDAHNLGVLASMDTLKSESVLDLEICESALEQPVLIHPTGSLGQHFGITYGGGKIKSVLVDSLAHRAGLEPNFTFVSVKGKSAVGKTDEDVVYMLTNALKERQPFVVGVMKARAAERLTSGIALTVAGMCRNPKFALTTPAMVIDSDFDLGAVRTENKHEARLLKKGLPMSARRSLAKEGRHTVCEDVSGSAARGSTSSARGSVGDGGLGCRWSMLPVMNGRESVVSGARQHDVVRVTGSAPPRMSLSTPAIPEGNEGNRNANPSCHGYYV